MQKIECFEDVKYNLKQGYVVSTDGKDMFYFSNGMITHKFKGNAYRIDFDTFIDLYKNKTFYLIEDNGVYIDEEKDKEYYERYPK